MHDKANNTSLIKKILVSIITGILCGAAAGLACSIFCLLTSLADNIKMANTFLLYFLPLTGLLVVFLYKRYDKENRGNTDEVIVAARENRKTSFAIVPLIFISTTLAYLTGGSLGRVDPSFQVGGGTVLQGADLFQAKVGKFGIDTQLIGTCGLSTAFAVMLNAPLAGILAGMELMLIDRKRWYYIVGTAASAGTGIAIVRLLGIRYTQIHLETDMDLTKIRPDVIAEVMLIALLTTLVARLFMYTREYVQKAAERIFANEYLRVLAGTVLVVILVKISGTMDYSSIGMEVTAKALTGEADSFAFLWKILLTALTLGCGIRGGEVAPVIFTGATFGCVFGAFCGFDPALCAAIGLAGTLSSTLNCTLTVFVFCCETIVFKPSMCLYFAITCIITHVLSGTKGLFSAQGAEKIKFKLKIP